MKITFLFFCTLLAALTLSAQDCTPAQYQKMLKEADQAVKRGEYDLSGLLDIHPDNEQLLLATHETWQIAAFADLYAQQISQTGFPKKADYDRATRLYRACLDSGVDNAYFQKKMEDLKRVWEFWEWLPELWAYELAQSQTGYWIMQPMKPHLRREPPTAANGFKPSYYAAIDENVADFAAIPLDLDVGRPGRPTAGEAIEEILAESLAGTIPTPTYLAYSGRGTYAIWQLRQTVPNTPTNHSRWRAILLRLIARTRSLELSPDPIASNPARWYKIPNTVDTNTNNRVAYLPISIDHGPVARYTFDELEAALGMLVLPSIPETEKASPIVRREHRTEHHERKDKRDGSYVH
jgi:hypothetical protein